jgi:hypothetical protein
MRMRILMGLPLLAVTLGAGACASSEQWAEWKKHSSHFASGEHMSFSLRNQGASRNVRRSDTQLASAQSWWGDPIVVRPDQIFQ